MSLRRRALRGLTACLALAACAHLPSPGERRALADGLAHAHGWHGETLRAGAFALRAYLPDARLASDTLTVYVEGDGLAWLTPSQPSSDPTPRDPLALRLAMAQPLGAAVYLARPCQFVTDPACRTRDWTSRRFAREIIDATNAAIDALAARAGATRVVLVGYSGGGAVAALAAAQRDDVALLVTVAGNLDPAAWTAHHRVAPLDGSLSPADEITALARVRQVHVVGSADRIVPPALVQSFAARFPAAARPRVELEAGVDHACCWVERWPELARRLLAPEATAQTSSRP